jgi:hypothetical protein
MSVDDSRARRAWQWRVLLVAGFAATASGCGRSVSRTDGTAGTAASMAGRGDSGGTGGSTGGTADSGGTGGAGGSTGGTGATSGSGAAGGSTGGTADSGGTGGTGALGGAGGEAGAPLVNPTECVGATSSRGPCEGGCTLNAAFALRCPSPLLDIELAGSNLLVEHATGASLYGFHFEGGLITLDAWTGTDVRRELATDNELPIVAHEAGAGDVLLSPTTTAGGTHALAAGLLLDVAYDDENVRILERVDRRVTLHSIATDASITSNLLSDDAQAASFVRGSSPPRIALVDRAGVTSIQGEGEPRAVNLPSPVRPDTSWFSAVALGERLLLGSMTLGTDGTDGTYIVDDAGVARSFGATRALRCPDEWIAEYPDICEFELIPDVTTHEAVLAAELVVHEGEPWLVSIVGAVTDHCRTFVGRCFESRPCDCSYRRFGSTVDAALRLENLDDPARVLRVKLGDLPNETVQLAASSSETGMLFIAIAEGQFSPDGGSHAGAVIDYLLLTP